MSSERRFIRRVLIVLALASLFYIGWQLRTLLLMLFGAVVVATVFRAFADRICRLTGLRERVGTVLAIVIILGTAVGLIALFGTQVAQQVQSLRETIPAT